MTAATRLTDYVQADVLSRMWWALMLKAAAISIFAGLAFFGRGRSLTDLVLLFAIYGLADGLLSIVASIRGGGLRARVGLTVAGVASVAASLVALLPDLSWEAFASIVAGWAIVRGGCEFVSALTLRRYMERDWSLALIGMLAMMFGAGVLLRTGLEPWTFVRLLSAYSLITGLLLSLLAIRFLRGLRP